ncbi:MAG: host attachment family protein [Lysobacter sp.]
MKNMPEGTLVLVADGGNARTFRSQGDGKTVKLEQKDVLTPQNVNDEGPSGSRPHEQTESQTDEATFAKQLAHRLNDGALKNAYAHLVLVADPQTLGQMRPQLHKETSQRLLFELAKTLTNATLQDIEKALAPE